MKYFKAEKKEKILNNEKGVYLVLLAGIMFAIFAVLGLGVDSGRLYLSSLYQQRAADAGAVSAGLYIGLLSGDEIAALAVSVAQDNLDGMDVEYSEANIDDHIQAVYSEAQREIVVTTEAVTETLLMGKIVPSQEFWSLSAQAAATRDPVSIAMVMDVTGSMSRNADPDCVSNCDTKLEAMQAAAIQFVDKFDTLQDKIALISFSEEASVHHSLADAFDKDVIAAKINSFTANGATSIHAGLKTAREEFASHGADNPGRKKIIVLVTDGAPNLSEGGDYPNNCPVNNPANAQHYIYPLLEVDAARENDNVTVYSIGTGALDNDVSSAFQDSADSYTLKSILMRRISNDAPAAADLGDPDFPDQCVGNYNSIAHTPVGQYLETPDATDLNYLLLRVARSILTRLVR